LWLVRWCGCICTGPRPARKLSTNFLLFLITSMKYYECVSILACVKQHYNFILSAPCCSVFCSLFFCVLLFHIIWYKARLSEKNFIDHKMNVLIFPTTFSRTFLVIRTTQRGILDLCRFSYKVPYFSSTYFNQTCILSTDLRIRSMLAELFHAERLTDEDAWGSS
jgi:hypothetical protein